MSLGLDSFYLLRSISCHVSSVVTPMVLWISQLTSMQEDAGLNPAWDTKFFFHFRDMCQKPPVSYFHLSIINVYTRLEFNVASKGMQTVFS